MQGPLSLETIWHQIAQFVAPKPQGGQVTLAYVVKVAFRLEDVLDWVDVASEGVRQHKYVWPVSMTYTSRLLSAEIPGWPSMRGLHEGVGVPTPSPSESFED